MAALTKIGIVNARNTDGYALIYEYSDGTQSGQTGWYGSYDAAEYAALGLTPAVSDDELVQAGERLAADGVVIEDWTEKGDDA